MDTAERKLRELEERVVGTVKTDAETDRRKPQERCGRPLRLPATTGDPGSGGGKGESEDSLCGD